MHAWKLRTWKYLAEICEILTFLSAWAAFRNLFTKTYAVGTDMLNCNVLTISFSCIVYNEETQLVQLHKSRTFKGCVNEANKSTISRTSFLVYALSDMRIRSPTTGTETSSYLHAKSIATSPTNWSFFLTTVCFAKNLSIRLTVRNNVSCMRSNLSCTWRIKTNISHY